MKYLEVLQTAISDYYRPKESFEPTKTCAQINLENLLNHPSTRFLTYLKDVLYDFRTHKCDSFELISKWCCYGPQQAKFKQKMDNNATDSNISKV